MSLKSLFKRGGSTAGEMPFLDHLEELRWRILKAGSALIVGAILGYVIVQRFGVMEILIRPVRPLLGESQLAALSPLTPFMVTLKLALVVGLILAFPIVVHQVWSFLSPGLTREEKRVIVPSLYFGLLLFMAGVAGAYFMVLPLALKFLSAFQQDYIDMVYEVGAYLSFVTKLLIAFGIAFELPVVVMILSALGLMTPKFMRAKRRHAIVIIAAVAVVMTPGGDLASSVLMTIPMVVLYEISIFLSAAIQRRREERESENRLLPSEEPPAGAIGIRGPWDGAGS
jgi:sec-independent protein translocase protein TatC